MGMGIGKGLVIYIGKLSLGFSPLDEKECGLVQTYTVFRVDGSSTPVQQLDNVQPPIASCYV